MALPHARGGRAPQVGTVRIAPAHYPPPDHGGRHLRGLRFLFSARTEKKAAEPASHTLTPHPSRHVRPARKSAAPPPAATPEKPPPCIPPAASPRHSSPHRHPRLRLPPSPTGTKKAAPSPEPPPFIRVLNTPHPRHPHPPPSRLGKSTLFLPRLPRPRRPGKRRPAPLSDTPTHPPAPGKSTGARPPHPHPLHPRLLSPRQAQKKRHPRWNRHPSSAFSTPRAPLRRSTPAKKPPSPTAGRNARKNVTLHPAGRLPAPLLAEPPRASPRHSSPSRHPRHSSPRLLPGRHKKSGSPLKAAALRSNRRAISCP